MNARTAAAAASSATATNTSNDDDTKYQHLTQLVNAGGSPDDHTPLGGQNRQLYQPTPRELSYALYILEQIFPSSYQLYQQQTTNNASSSNTTTQTQTQISIEGRDAVAFLTTSAIHRSILRIFWNVVDPLNVGRLTDIGQFHTIVRLTALTQAGYVEDKLLALGTTHTTTLPPTQASLSSSPVSVVWEILNTTTHIIKLPLAQFSSVQIPSQEFLQQLYTTHQQRRLGMMGVSGHAMSSSSSSNNDTMVLPPQAGTPATDGTHNYQPNMNTTTTTTATTLTRMQQPQSSDREINTPQQHFMMQQQQQQHGGIAPSLSTLTNNVQPPVMGLAALDALGPTTDAPLSAVFNGTTTTKTATNNETENDFGEFEDAALKPSANPEGAGFCALDALGLSTDAPLPALGITTATTTTNEDQDDFGGFEDAVSTPVVTGFGALDALGPSTDAPLPALGITTATNEEEDSFGGFEDAASDDPKPPEAPDVTGFVTLGVLGPLIDAPLPALGRTAINEDEDAFGGFEDAASDDPKPPETPDLTGFGALDALGPAADTPLPALGTVAAAAANDNNAFGGFENAAAVASAAPAPNGIITGDALGDNKYANAGAFSVAAVAVADDDDFGDFSDAAPATAAAAATAEVSGMDAFDALAGSQDAPLPSFTQTQSDRGLEGAAPHYSSSLQSSNSLDVSDTAMDPEPSSIAAVNGTPVRHRLSMQGTSFRRRSSRSLGTPEQDEKVPTDLMPNMPGEKYVETVRRNSLRKLPEFSDNDDEETEDQHEDPFAGMDPVLGNANSFDSFSKPIQLNETPTPLSPGNEGVPEDLKPQPPSKHYVKNPALQTLEEPDEEDDEFGRFEEAPKSPLAFERVPEDLNPRRAHRQYVKSPSLQTLEEPGEENEEFGGFEEAPTAFLKVPDMNLESQPDPFSISMPKDLNPNAPGEHYVHHGANERATPGGLRTVAESSSSSSKLPRDDPFGTGIHLNPPSTLPAYQAAMPHDLMPPVPGKHFVPHKPTPGSLSTLEEALDEIQPTFDAIPPPPGKLTRQATPDVHDLVPMKGKTVAVPGIATLHESNGDEDDFGGFAESTPAPHPDTLSLTADEALNGGGIKEDDAVNDDVSSSTSPSPDPFSAFDTLAEAPAALPPLPSFSAPASNSTVQIESVFTMTDIPDRTLPQTSTEHANFESFATMLPVSAPAINATTSADFSGMIGSRSVSSLISDDEDEGEDTDAFQNAPTKPISSPPSEVRLTAVDSLSDEAFDDFTGPKQPPAPSQLLRQATPAVQELDRLTKKASSGMTGNAPIVEEANDEDDFGGFATAGPASGAPSVSIPPESRQADLPVNSSKTEVSSGVLGDAPILEEYEAEDDFGDFGGFESASESIARESAAPVPPQLMRNETPRPHDLIQAGAKSVETGLMSISEAGIQREEKDSADIFGDFGGFESAIDGTPEQTAFPTPTQMTITEIPLHEDLDQSAPKAVHPGLGSTGEAAEKVEEDDFGDFGSFEQAEPPLHGFNDSEVSAPRTDDRFVDSSGFDSAPAPASEPDVATARDDNFGSFSAFKSTPAASDDDFGDFTAFEAASADTSGDDEWNVMREKVISLSQQLPSSIHNSFDIGKAFDRATNGGCSSAFTGEDLKKQVEHCIQVLSLVSAGSKHAKLASTYWAETMVIVRDELSLGNRLLNDVCKLSMTEQAVAAEPLQIMVAGMGEYVRVIRCIMASIADMMLSDLSAVLTGATLMTTWGSIPLATAALEIESLWTKIIDMSTTLGLPRTTSLETIVDIRSRCMSRWQTSTDLCQLSLQPLWKGDKETTKAAVLWQGKSFMACSANLLANKCPFYTIEE